MGIIFKIDLTGVEGPGWISFDRLSNAEQDDRRPRTDSQA